MAKRQFKAESRRLMEMMINSIYTHKEVFLRELISNASDALDKLYFLSLEEGRTGVSREQMKIWLETDKSARTLTIRDNGCGMTKEALIDNLGTIARSGTLDFREEHKEADAEIIGQFGVGFYSAFMVSRKIEVRSRAFGAEEAWLWKSEGEDGYTLSPCQMEDHGTEVILHLNEDTEEEKYSQYLEQYTISSLVKKYSDYVRYPILMKMERSRPKEGVEGEYETVVEEETLNSMVPIWRKNKDQLTEADYNEFYKNKFFDFQDPLRVINTKVEGAVMYDALLYLPAGLPYNYYTKNFRKGLQLYCNGVLIMENCPDLLPDHFAFVKGIVDSPDFSLNISREMLQHDRQLKLIAKNIESKIRSELAKMMEKEREKYQDFFKNFGLQLKYGLYESFGARKEELKDLLLFHSLREDKPISFKEYREGMEEEQSYIYYACGETVERIKALPQADAIREKGLDILCMTDDVDEFAVKLLRDYDGKEFRSVSDSDLGLASEEEQAALEKKAEENKGLLEHMKKALEGKVEEVRLSSRLKSHPVCLVSDGALSLEMEQVLNAMPAEEKVKARRVLEVNGGHPVFEALVRMEEKEPETVDVWAGLLYDQAVLMAGMPLEDPAAFAGAVCGLMERLGS
ncbi:MAG: molecular chaperone HtpG [Bacillota bacterium]|nr:molecular chaperone HtpG [Bacillota bacterium]